MKKILKRGGLAIACILALSIFGCQQPDDNISSTPALHSAIPAATATETPTATPSPSGQTSFGTNVSIPGDGTLTFSPTTISVAKGTLITISVSETNYATYQWLLDGVVITNATSASLSLETDSLFVGIHQLAIVVTDSAGVSSSGNCRISINN